MIKNWGIRRERGKWRRYRYSLLLGSEFDDVISVLGRVANVCGRPRKERGVAAYSMQVQSNEAKTVDYLKTVVSCLSLPEAQIEQSFVAEEPVPAYQEPVADFQAEPGAELDEQVSDPSERAPERVSEAAQEPIEAAIIQPAEPQAEPEPRPRFTRRAQAQPVREEPVLEEPVSIRQEQEPVEAVASEPVPELAPEPEPIVLEQQPEAEPAQEPAQEAAPPARKDGQTVPNYLETELQKLASRLIPKNIAQAAEQAQESEDALRSRIEGEIKAKIEAEEDAKHKAEDFIRKETEMKLRIEAELRSKLEAEAHAKEEAEATARKEEDSLAQKEAELKARLEAEIRSKLEAELKSQQIAAPAPAVSATMPPQPEPAPAPEPVPEPEPEPTPETEEPAGAKKGPLILEYGAAGPHKQTWSVEIPLVPTYNFDTLVVGANRFAHAAGMSVIESPGTMYNPLMLHGPSCCGKSHFLHAIAYGLSKDMGQQNIFVTDGVRLSRGVLRLAKEGKLEGLEKTLENIKALFVDDVHLMSVTDQNKAFLSKWLNHFFQKKKQIVLTSLYPPKNLARLETALSFQFNRGWIVELKASSQGQTKSIVQSMVARSGIELPEDDINKFFAGSNLSLSQIEDSLDKLRVMTNITPREDAPNYQAMLSAILGTAEESGTMLPTEDDIKAATAFKRPEGASWGRWGFFYPQGMQQYVPWVIFPIFEKMSALGIGGGLDSSVQLEYDSANMMLSAFRISDVCSEKGLRGAVVILPPDQPGSEQARNEFSHTLEHLTSTLFVRCAMIEPRSLGKQSSYLGAVLNMVA